MILSTAKTSSPSRYSLSPVGPRSLPLTSKEWRQTANKLASVELEFMFNSAFRSPELTRKIMDAVPLTVDIREQQWRPSKGMPSHLARLCEATLLKPAEEVALFRRMNFCKYEADRLRRTLNLSRPSQLLIGRIQALLTQAQRDRERIVRANLRLVVSIAKKFANSRLSFEDLLSEGISSLLRAVEKFDFDRGFRFSTYATQAVRRTLCRQLQTAQRDSTRFINADVTLFEDQQEDANDSTLTESRWEELRGKLRRLLARLDPRERAIIRRRFGLDHAAEVPTLQSLANEMGVCKERVRQLEMRAIAKLRSLAEHVRLSPEQE